MSATCTSIVNIILIKNLIIFVNVENIVAFCLYFVCISQTTLTNGNGLTHRLCPIFNCHMSCGSKKSRMLIFFSFLSVPVQVICNVCGHVSIIYEPFMYLSVPLPRAMEKQFGRFHDKMFQYVSCFYMFPFLKQISAFFFL